MPKAYIPPHYREPLALDYWSRGLSISQAATELGISRKVAVELAEKLEKAGKILISRDVKPWRIQVLHVTANAGYINPSNSISEKLGNSECIWGLRNFALKFAFQGRIPHPRSMWVPINDGWKGGPAFNHYIRGARASIYFGKNRPTATLVLFAPPDMEDNDAKALEHEATEWCKRTASWLAGKMGWTLEAPYNVLGEVVPIRKGEYDCRPLRPVAQKFAELGALPIYHKDGKMDYSPKPAAFQIYGPASQADRVWTAPYRLDTLETNINRFVDGLVEQRAAQKDYNANLKKHLRVLGKMERNQDATYKLLKRLEKTVGKVR
ncbi:MAG: hypothetical protein WC759_00135 [Candidatus Micrarchaeia archaeon]|jgi:hypothetical protein